MSLATGLLAVLLALPGPVAATRPADRPDPPAETGLSTHSDLSTGSGRSTHSDLSAGSDRSTQPGPLAGSGTWLHSGPWGGDSGSVAGLGRYRPTSPDGQPWLRYAVGAEPAGRRTAGHPVQVSLLDRRGEPAPAPTDEHDGINRAFFFDLGTAELAGVATDGQTLVLPAGGYLVASAVRTPEPGTRGSRTLVVHPELMLAGAATVTLDARTGRRVGVTVDRPGAERTGGTVGVVVRDFAEPWQVVDFGLPLHRADEVYAAPTGGAGNPRLTFYHRELREEPTLRLDVTAPEQFPLKVQSYADGSLGVPRLLGGHRLAVAYGGSGTPAELAGRPVRGRLVVLRLTVEESRDDALVTERISTVASAGGRAVLFTGPVRDVYDAPIPVGHAVEPAVDRLVALAETGDTRVSWTELPASPYRYDAVFTGRARVPAGSAHRLRDTEFAAIRTTYHGQRRAGLGGAQRIALVDGLRLDTVSVVPWPLRRTEYVTPGRWQSTLWNYEWGIDELYGEPVEYAAGESGAIDWNRAVHGPLPPADPVDGPAWAYREADQVRVLLPLFTDSAGHTRVLSTAEPPEPLLRGGTELYRDDVLLGRSEYVGYGDFEVPAGPGRYTLRATAERISPLYETATTVAATWSFSIAPGPGRVPLPLLGVRARAEVDERNRGPAGRPVRLGLDLLRAGVAGPVPARTLTVSISTDDGRSWRAVPVRADGAGWTASYLNPTNGYVSLRLAASDADGNTVESTVLRAYPVG